MNDPGKTLGITVAEMVLTPAEATAEELDRLSTEELENRIRENLAKTPWCTRCQEHHPQETEEQEQMKLTRNRTPGAASYDIVEREGEASVLLPSGMWRSVRDLSDEELARYGWTREEEQTAEPTQVNVHQVDLQNWWHEVSQADLDLMLPKVTEYGSQDLEVMGRAMIALHPNRDAMDPGEQRRVGLEMAVAFYLLGKVSRLFGAYSGGGVPSDDTWHDATVYSMMGRRVRETGGWPA